MGQGREGMVLDRHEQVCASFPNELISHVPLSAVFSSPFGPDSDELARTATQVNGIIRIKHARESIEHGMERQRLSKLETSECCEAHALVCQVQEVSVRMFNLAGERVSQWEWLVMNGFQSIPRYVSFLSLRRHQQPDVFVV